MKRELITKYVGSDGRTYESKICDLSDDNEFLFIVDAIDLMNGFKNRSKFKS